jgi:outer membrane receptor protein involved in Fe transport
MDKWIQRRAWRRAAAVASLIAIVPVAAIAQSTPPETTTLEEVTVTGSRIKRPNLESASPVTVVGSDEIKYQGTSSIESTINKLPQFTADSNENGSNGSDGTARVNLRDLGPDRVLVLIDGQRMLPFESADVNFIPSVLVDRVDVLTGGASAVYGSDAVAGVVNFIMKKDLQGVRIDAQYGIANHKNRNGYTQSLLDDAGFERPDSSVWDGARTDISIALGMNTPDGQGNATFYLGYRELDPVRQNTRDYSACGLNLAGVDALVCGGSSNNQWGQFTPLSGANQSVTFNNAKDGTKTWLPYDNSYLYNYAPTNYIQRQDKRVSAGAFAHYDYNEHAQIYGSLMFMDDHTFSQAAPSAYFAGTPYAINCNNPLMSTQQASLLCGPNAGTPAVVNSFIGYRFGDDTPRRDDLRHTDYRVNLGVRGDIVEGWTYDVSGLSSQVVLDESYKNDLDPTKGARALQVELDGAGVPQCRSFIDGSDPNCRPANVFNAFGLSTDAYGYIFTPTYTRGVDKETVLNAVVNGDLTRYGVKLPWASEALALALGVEHRTEQLSFEADAVALSKGATESFGSFKVDEAFIELDVPIAEDLPGIHQLTLNTGYRYSDYQVADGGSKANTYKVELQYAPVQAVKFRGSFNRAVRAPNISELFSPQGLGNVSGQDPCSGPTPERSLAECQRSGVTPAQYGLIIPCPADTCVTQFGGNLDLEPEEADTKTFGFVLQPEALPEFSFSADYYDITVNGYIGSVDSSIVINECIAEGVQFFCDLFHRDPNTGVLFGTQGYIVATNQNTGFLKTSGIDVTGSYGFSLDSAGSINFDLVGTKLISNEVEQLPGLGSYDCKGLFGPTCGQPAPTWRHNLRATWLTGSGKGALSLNWRYFGGTKLSSNTELGGGAPPIEINAEIPAYSYIDLFGSWKLGDSTEVRLGINNVMDKGPPAIAAGLLTAFGNGNTYPGVYDPMGRLLFAGVKFGF